MITHGDHTQMENENTNNETVEDVITSEDVAVEEQDTEPAEELDESSGDAVTENASAAEDEESEDVDDVDDKSSKSKKNFNKRVKQLIEQREVARREAEDLRKQIQTQTQTQAPVVQEVEFNKPKPVSTQFTTIAEYTEALVDWKEEKRDFDRQQEALARQIRETVTKNTETWLTREKTIKADLEDYDAVVNVDSLGDVNLTKPTHDTARSFLAESEYGPAVLYELLQNDELAKTFKDAGVNQQIKILTKLELKIESAKSKSTQTTAVKEEIKTPPKLKGGLKTNTKSMEDVLASGDFAEYAKFRKSQKQR